jgi:ribosomal protein L40E
MVCWTESGNLIVRLSIMENPRLARLAVPVVTLLIALLSYGSQLLFPLLDPGSLESSQSYKFNILVACIWISYARAIITDSGRVPPGWTPDQTEVVSRAKVGQVTPRQRYCRKCDAVKPARSHHCKICKRCGAHDPLEACADSGQMYPQDGSSLPMDIQLCFAFHLSPFHALSLVCSCCHDVPRVFSISTS